MRRVWRVVREQAGYSMIELLTVLIILGTILTGLTTAFVQGSNAEVQTNRRVQAQIQAGLAFDRLRRDIHCASSATVAGTTLTLSGCGTGSVSWSSATSSTCQAPGYTLYALSRTANSFTKQYSDCLTSTSLFTYTASVAGVSLAKVHAAITVNVNPAKTVDSFQLQDDIVLRNSSRT
jgi:prepilin-type N-terminal cleavage/methylation domain-containing protein